MERAHRCFLSTRHSGLKGVEARFEKLTNVQSLLEARRPEYAKIMSEEMGKPVTQGLAEVARCSTHIDYSKKVSLGFLADEPLDTPGDKAFLTYDPVGPVLDIVPWNFPFWVPFKSMIPPFVLGNPILMKHAPSCPLSAAALEQLFIDAGFDNGEYQNLYITNEQCDRVLSDPRVRGVKFTGSTGGGKAVAAVAGSNMKQGCYELGGSDPFCVLEDADLNLAVEKAYASRMANNG